MYRRVWLTTTTTCTTRSGSSSTQTEPSTSSTTPSQTSSTFWNLLSRSTSRTSTKSSAWTSPSAEATCVTASTCWTRWPRTSSLEREIRLRRRPNSARWPLTPTGPNTNRFLRLCGDREKTTAQDSFNRHGEGPANNRGGKQNQIFLFYI